MNEEELQALYADPSFINRLEYAIQPYVAGQANLRRLRLLGMLPRDVRPKVREKLASVEAGKVTQYYVTCARNFVWKLMRSADRIARRSDPDYRRHPDRHGAEPKSLPAPNVMDAMIQNLGVAMASMPFDCYRQPRVIARRKNKRISRSITPLEVYPVGVIGGRGLTGGGITRAMDAAIQGEWAVDIGPDKPTGV